MSLSSGPSVAQKQKNIQRNMIQLCAHRSGSVFTIIAVINHMGGTPKEGHYSVMLYDKVNELYFSLDDMNITTHSSIPKNTNRTHYIAVYLKTE
jgi:uncharacterized UBP type Zn finger protein